jgi:hypothetical protein
VTAYSLASAETGLAQTYTTLAAQYEAAGYPEEARKARGMAAHHMAESESLDRLQECAVPYAGELYRALKALLDNYVALHDSGDAGTPLPEDAPVRMRAEELLKRVRG